jgi:hypothetical protein
MSGTGWQYREQINSFPQEEAMRAAALLIALMPCVAAFSATPARAPESTPVLAALDFLLGNWSSSSSTTGAGDQFRRDLDGHVLMRLSRSDVRSPTSAVSSALQSTMTIYPSVDGSQLRAIYFDSVGHVIHYKAGAVVRGQRIQFLSDGSDPGPTFRITYERAARDQLHVKFEMATPDKPNAFAVVAEGDEHLAP